MNKLRILLAEDHETVREGLKLLINARSDMEVVGEAGDGGTVLEKARELRPDIILLDISMPEVNGLHAAEKIGRLFPRIKILVLTRHTDDGYLQQLIQAGARGYVLKQSDPAELITAIRAVGRGRDYLDPSLTEKTMGGFIRQSTALNGADGVRITPRESEVLRLIALGHKNREIAEQLRISVKTVEAHKSNAMRKLGISSRVDIVNFGILKGWMDGV